MPNETKTKSLIGAEAEKISPNIEVRYIYDERKRWVLYLAIDDKISSSDELRKAWPKIEEARDFLLKIQGGDPNDFSTILLDYVNSLKEYSTSLTISKEMNFFALMYFLVEAQGMENPSHRIFGVNLFQKLLKTFQMKKTDIQKWTRIGIDARKNGQLPWGLTNGPITPRRVTDSLLQFRKKMQSIPISPRLDADQPFLLNNTLIHYHGIWQKAEDLLKKEEPKEFKKFERHLNGVYNDATIIGNISLRKEIEEEWKEADEWNKKQEFIEKTLKKKSRRDKSPKKKP